MAMVPPFIRLKDLAPDPTTSRVYPGIDGRLVYVPDEQGNTIIDSSHAGYKGGGVAIPTVPVRETIWPVSGDNTANVQAAIDRVSALPLDANGFRGALVLKAGYYRMATPIQIRASGVVLRGEGMGDTGTILIGTGTGRPETPPGGGPGGGDRAADPVGVPGDLRSTTHPQDPSRRAEAVAEDGLPRRVDGHARGADPGSGVPAAGGHREP